MSLFRCVVPCPSLMFFSHTCVVECLLHLLCQQPRCWSLAHQGIRQRQDYQRRLHWLCRYSSYWHAARSAYGQMGSTTPALWWCHSYCNDTEQLWECGISTCHDTECVWTDIRTTTTARCVRIRLRQTATAAFLPTTSTIRSFSSTDVFATPTRIWNAATAGIIN